MLSTFAFGTSIFLSAFFLFMVQPMVARLLLPYFGGSPGVWNTCMLFFQGLLLAGYTYSHWGPKWLGSKRHVVLHAILLIVPLALLPPALDPSWAPPREAWPIPSLLRALALAVGGPFLLLTTNGSLMQHWFAKKAGREPYFLYSASNVGSLLGLLGYPVVVEPLLTLKQQATFLTFGYAAFAVATLACMALTWQKLGTEDVPEPVLADGGAETWIPWTRRLRWIALAMVPTFLLLAVSLRITTDIAPVPFLWVIPLAIYLLTFIVAFLPNAPRPGTKTEILGMLFVTMGLSIGGSSSVRLVPMLRTTLGALLAGSWVCHADLAKDRPGRRHVTEFFLWISVGGFLGGIAANLIAPLLFDSIAEFPIAMLFLAFVFMSRKQGLSFRDALRHRLTLASAAVMVVVLGAAVSFVRSDAGRLVLVEVSLWAPLGVLLLGIALFRFGAPFVIASALVCLVRITGVLPDFKILESERSFFGTLRIVENIEKGKKVRVMLHGSTLHGTQQVDPPSDVPTIYYHPKAPVGQTMYAQADEARIGIVGLGTGAIAALSKPGQKLTYFELDPTVEPMARKWFTYLDVSKAPVRQVLGDARLTLASEPDAGYDFLLIDAFSSDAIPVHLLTIEALKLYLQKLDENGVLLLHISNRYLELDRVMRGAWKELGIPGGLRVYTPTKEEFEEGALPSVVVAFAHREDALQNLGREQWKPFDPSAPSVVWTDDYTSVFGVFKASPRRE